jgi:hypothetical protein
MIAQTTICKLCLRVRPLVRSHIVPEFAYKPMKNEQGVIYVLGDKKKKVQTGHYERLLCEDCETLLSKYETYFVNDWMRTIPPNISHLLRGPDPSLTVQIADYTKFKLFHLSVFWRAAVSSFKIDPSISLGSHERVIAEMILKGDPGEPGDFPFVASLNYDANGTPVPTVSPLAKSSDKFDGGYDCYLISYAYCDWMFIDGRPGPEFLVQVEKHLKSHGAFTLLTTRFEQSKTAGLFVDAMRKRRKA